MNITQEHLKALAQRAFEDGWNATGQGFNAEHHNATQEALAQMRDDAVEGRLEELRKELEPKTFAIVRFSEFDRSAPGTVVAEGITKSDNALKVARSLNDLRRGSYAVFTAEVLREKLVDGKVTI